MEGENEDYDEVLPFCFKIRERKEFPEWRQHSDSELLILQGIFNTPISVDKVTMFSLRPPDLKSHKSS